jgi:hypothetical protein
MLHDWASTAGLTGNPGVNPGVGGFLADRTDDLDAEMDFSRQLRTTCGLTFSQDQDSNVC